jgi:1-acyl-sn-glycerol-3-phosphate acyltransferase
MRPLYLLLKFSLAYSLRLFYRRQLTINEHHERFGSTIYVSNHPNSFMDPLLIGARNRPVVHFMTRSDVFKWWLKPILWASHMLPIYRQHDGEDTKSKNSDAFKAVNNHLRKRNNILIFGEGFTDDIPIRSLKPVKKGAIRMGFQALEQLNWEPKIYISALGVNYSDRNTIGSDFVIVNGDKICLNDYKDAYLESKAKVVNEITKRVEKEMQECIIYVKDKHWFSLHENIMKITRKGYNNESYDPELSLESRFRYAQKLARWVNEHSAEDEGLNNLKKELDGYFALIKRMKIEDQYVYAASKNETTGTARDLAWLLMFWPLALFGAINAFVPYIIAKKVTEKIMRRKVFWGSVKMMLGKLLGTLFVLPIAFVLMAYLVPQSWPGYIYYLLVFAYFLIVPEFWRLSYEYARIFKRWQTKRAIAKADLSKFVQKRQELELLIKNTVPEM